MEKEPDDTHEAEAERPAPPPFAPDPELITERERDAKPSPAEVAAVTGK